MKRQSVSPWSSRVLIAALSLSVPTLAGPPGDYGDAPVGNTGSGIDAYPGVGARWTTYYQHTNMVASPVQHNHGTWLTPGGTIFLGDVPPTVKSDTLLDPLSPENDAFPQIVVNNLAGVTLAELQLRVRSTPSHTAGTYYLNVFIDQNRDGQWKDGYFLGTPLAAWTPEWQVADYPIDIQQPNWPVDLILVPIALADPLSPVWVRMIISDAKIGTILKAGATFWDTTMPQVHGWKGEVEDSYLSYNPNPPPNVRQGGVWLRRVYYSGRSGPRKPACDVRYTGPKEITLPACPATVPIPFNFRVSDRGGGCALADALVGIYGIRPVVGGPGPTVNFLAGGLPAGSNFGAGGPAMLTCPNGLELALPAAIDGFGRLWQGTIPPMSLAPSLNVLDGCYGVPPKNQRRWRVFIETRTCGSDHRVLTVADQPRLPQNLVSYVSSVTDSTIGSASGFVDLLFDGSEEEFGQPPLLSFPHPDFANYTFLLESHSSLAELSAEQFVSSPTSLRLREAIYSVMRTNTRPTLGSTTVSVRYMGVPGQMILISTGGQIMSGDMAPALGWSQVAVTTPPGFEVGTIVISMTDGWIDDVDVSPMPGPLAPPENDNWRSAFPIGVGEEEGTTLGSTLQNLLGVNGSCISNSAMGDVWYSFIADSPTVTVAFSERCASPCVTSRMALYSEDLGPPIGCSVPSGPVGAAAIVADVVPGARYLLRVVSSCAAGCDFTVYLSFPPVGTLGCAGATPVDEGIWPFDVLLPGAPPGPGDCFSPGSEPFDGWWWRYTATFTGVATADTCAIDVIDNTLALFPGVACPSPLTPPIQCSDDACGRQPSITFNTIAGRSYLLRVKTGPNSAGSWCFGTLTIKAHATCRADFNNSGAVSLQDVFDFLAAYFSGGPLGDFNQSGTTTVQDIFDYLAEYFAGC